MSPTDAVYEFAIFGSFAALLLLLVISFPKTVVTPRKFSVCVVAASCAQIVLYDAVVFDGSEHPLGILGSAANAFRVVTVTLLSLVPATIVWLHTRRVLADIAAETGAVVAESRPGTTGASGSALAVEPALRGAVLARVRAWRRRTLNRIGLLVSLAATTVIFLVYKALRVAAQPRRLLRLFG